MSERQCSCLEVLGENLSCPFHGIGTDWWARAIHDDPLARAELVERLQEHDRRVTELLEANNREVERRRRAEAAFDARGRVIDEMMEVVAGLRERLAAQAPREERAAALHDPAHVCPTHGIAWMQQIEGSRYCTWKGCRWQGTWPGAVDIQHEGKVR